MWVWKAPRDNVAKSDTAATTLYSRRLQSVCERRIDFRSLLCVCECLLFFVVSTVFVSTLRKAPPENIGQDSLTEARSAWDWWQNAEPVVVPSPSFHVVLRFTLSILLYSFA